VPDSLLRFLKTEFQNRQLRNKRYSLRKYAQDLSVSAAVMSRILSGKIPVSLKTLNKIANKVDVPENLIVQTQLKSQRRSLHERFVVQLTAEEVGIIKQWYFPIILEMLTLTESQKEISEIAEALDLPQQQVQSCIDLLVHKKFVKADVAGQYLTTKESKALAAINKEHEQSSEAQKNHFFRTVSSIDHFHPDDREHSTVFIKANSDVVPDIKNKIKHFKKNLSTYAEKKSRNQSNQVYQLSIGLNPLFRKR